MSGEKGEAEMTAIAEQAGPPQQAIEVRTQTLWRPAAPFGTHPPCLCLCGAASSGCLAPAALAPATLAPAA